MKQFIFILMALTMLCIPKNAGAQTTLTTLQPTEEIDYTPLKTGEKQIMMGGLACTTGFSLGQPTRYLITPQKIGMVTFPLNGKYQKLTFMMGPMANNHKISNDPTIVTVRGDGRKLVDEKFQDWDISRPFEIDVTGVNNLTFDILAGDGYIGIGKPQLWTAGQKAVKPDYDRTPAKTKMVLVKDRAPYYYNSNNVVLVGPNHDKQSFKLNGKQYDNGLVFNMTMQFIGGDYGSAMYNLKGQYEKLSFILGALDNNVNAEQGKGYLIVQGDGRTLYQKDLSQLAMAEQVVLDVTGVDRLSFHSSQDKWNMSAGFADITAWPKGEGPALGVTAVAAPSYLKDLPDVTPLLGTIEPFNVLGGMSRDQMIYDSKSDYLGFDMGGVKYSNGMKFSSSSNFLHDHVFSSASFDLGGEYDYMTFVTGFLNGPMKDGEIHVHVDDQLVYSVPIKITGMPQKHWVRLGKGRKLTFDNCKGGGNVGVADVVLYRGEIKDNDLFEHKKPNAPDNVSLLQYSMPYLHYIYALDGEKNAYAYNGSDISKFFTTRDGRKITEGFNLKTGVRFSLEHGVLSDEGEDGAIAGAVGAAAVGSSFVAGGMVGGAMVGSTLAGMAGLMMLAAGGQADDSSFAAFNTHGDYNTVSFTVECITPADAGLLSKGSFTDRQNRLLIGADGEVAAELMLNEMDGPQKFTVPINGCQQLLFFMPCDNGSGTYLIYDAELSKAKSELERPATSVKSHANVKEMDWTPTPAFTEWKKPDYTNASNLDHYFGIANTIYIQTKPGVEYYADYPRHELHTYYLKTRTGQVVKATIVVDNGGKNAVKDAKGVARALGANYEDHPVNIPKLAESLQIEIEKLAKTRKMVREAKVEQVKAAADIPKLGLGGIAYAKVLSNTNKMVNQCDKVLGTHIRNLENNYKQLDWLIKNAINVDGKTSDNIVIFTPLAPGETPPEGEELQLVETFK